MLIIGRYAGQKGLEVTVALEIDVSILYGLAESADVKVTTLMEIFLQNSFVKNLLVLACVWCGVTFLAVA